MEEHEASFQDLPLEARLDYLVELLAEEGFLARWEEEEGAYRLIEYSCPYLSLGQQHDEICAFDRELIVAVLNTDVEQHSCMLNGAPCCEFTIHVSDEQEAPVT